MTTLSVVIVTYNSEQTIEECCRSLQDQAPSNGTYSIVLCDNASQDATVERVKKNFPSIEIIQTHSNKGFASAANQAAMLQRSEGLLFVNPDVIVPPDFFQRLFGLLRAISGSFILGPQLRHPEGTIQPSFWKEPSLWLLACEMFLPYSVSLRLVTRKLEAMTDVECVSGACMYVTTDLFKLLGGFDERFFLYYEDVDLCLRARQRGYRVVGAPELRIIHRIGSSAWSDMSLFFRHFYRSKFQYFEKHCSPLVYRAALLIIGGGIILRIVSYAFIGILFFSSKFLSLSKAHARALLVVFAHQPTTSSQSPPNG